MNPIIRATDLRGDLHERFAEADLVIFESASKVCEVVKDRHGVWPRTIEARGLTDIFRQRKSVTVLWVTSKDLRERL